MYWTPLWSRVVLVAEPAEPKMTSDGDGVSVRRAVSLGLTLRYAIPRALTLVSGPMNATLVNFCSLGPSSSCPYLPKLVELDFRWDEKADPLRSTLRSLQMFCGLSL